MVKDGYQSRAEWPLSGRQGLRTKPNSSPFSPANEVCRFVSTPCFHPLPLYVSTVCAGFPSPADDYIESHIDLNEYLIRHQASTFIVRASGDSMRGAGIHSGDLLLVDKSLTPLPGKIVIAALNGELTVKRLVQQQGCLKLVAENSHYPAVDISEDVELVIWGVVTFVIHEAV